MLDFKVVVNPCRDPNSPIPTEEEVYKELLDMIHASDMQDPEVLGKFSPQGPSSRERL